MVGAHDEGVGARLAEPHPLVEGNGVLVLLPDPQPQEALFFFPGDLERLLDQRPAQAQALEIPQNVNTLDFQRGGVREIRLRRPLR